MTAQQLATQIGGCRVQNPLAANSSSVPGPGLIESCSKHNVIFQVHLARAKRAQPAKSFQHRGTGHINPVPHTATDPHTNVFASSSVLVLPKYTFPSIYLHLLCLGASPASFLSNPILNNDGHVFNHHHLSSSDSYKIDEHEYER